MKNKKIVAIIRNSAYKDLKKELPELFENEEIQIEVYEDHIFDYFIELPQDKQEDKK
jgi:hypothetical protein